MVDIFQKIAEQRIRQAIEDGEFDNLPGKGQPLQLEDDGHIPEDIRIPYKILKNANCLPPELEIKKEILRLEDMLANMPDEKEKYLQMKRLNFLIMKLNMLRKVPIDLEEKQRYYERLVQKFSTKK
ncbi:MAG TPA: DUF1992 domain-containing protein [Syntrophaceae bacterium]|nr:DUF1992 domain-containing protein [Syntrophaceae bacterium]